MGRRGFMVADLMASILVAGALTSVAVPAYQKYGVRAKMIECRITLEDLRRSAYEFLHFHERFPTQEEFWDTYYGGRHLPGYVYTGGGDPAWSTGSSGGGPLLATRGRRPYGFGSAGSSAGTRGSSDTSGSVSGSGISGGTTSGISGDTTSGATTSSGSGDTTSGATTSSGSGDTTSGATTSSGSGGTTGPGPGDCTSTEPGGCSRSGLGDGTNPGSPNAAEKSPNMGTNNPNQAPTKSPSAKCPDGKAGQHGVDHDEMEAGRSPWVSDGRTDASGEEEESEGGWLAQARALGFTIYCTHNHRPVALYQIAGDKFHTVVVTQQN